MGIQIINITVFFKMPQRLNNLSKIASTVLSKIYLIAIQNNGHYKIFAFDY